MRGQNASIGRNRRESGDTIVEVLICIGVIALVLTGAFAISNRSSTTVQDSNEHAQASLELQTQVEAFHAYKLPAGASFTSGTNYCMTADGSRKIISTSDNCNSVVGGATYKPYFTVGDGADSHTYTFTVEWDAIGGGTARETYIYRDYKS